MSDAFDRYRARLLKVLDHIDAHLDQPLDLTTLSAVSCFSPYHFHRQFSALMGITVHRYVHLARMKRASWRLAFRSEPGVTAIALDAGYEAPEAFARAFRKRFGQAPSEFREVPDWAAWRAALGPLIQARSRLMSHDFKVADVQLVETPDIPIAYMTHRRDPSSLGGTIRRFIEWRKRTGLHPAINATFTIFHNDADTIRATEYRVDLAVATDRRFDGNDQGIEHGVLPGGRCAMLRVVGGSDDLRPAARFLYGQWLPSSGEEARDAPLYCQRVRFFPDVPEHETITDLFLPLR